MNTELFVNTLNSSEITCLYEFLFCFETKIKNLKNNTSITALVDELNKYNTAHNIKLFGKRKSPVPNCDITIHNELHFTNYITNVLAFLTHLRNSIAHCQITSIGDCFVIKDFYNKKITMNGYVEKCHLIEIINMVLKFTEVNLV